MITRDVDGGGERRSIVVPLDGSRFAELALPTAAAIARASGARLCLVRVHEPISRLVLAEAGTPAPSGWDEPMRDAAREYIASAASRLRAEHGIHADTELAVAPQAPQAIAAHANEMGAELIVLTTHGRTGMSRTWLGSTADWLVRFGPVPVLLLRVPAGAEEPPREPAPYRHVLVPLDGSVRAEGAIAPAVRLGKLFDARYTLLMVVPPPPAPFRAPRAGEPESLAPSTAARVRHAEAYLRRVADRVRSEHGVADVRVEAMPDERAAAMILERAARRGVDLVAMSPRGLGASRLFLGSVADKVLRGFAGPVLLCGPCGERSEASAGAR